MIANTVLSSLVFNDDYTRKVLPYIKKEYFDDLGEQVVFALIKEYHTKYNKPPTKQILEVELENKQLKEFVYEAASSTLKEMHNPDATTEWLVDTTEDFCKKRAFYNVVKAAALLVEQGDTTLYNSMMDKVQDALSVTFDASLGHDFFEDAKERYDTYKDKLDQLSCGIAIFDRVTKGGFVNKTLTVFMAPTGVGKSLFLCNFAAQFLLQNKNVLYLTMEMSEVQVAQRIDLNMLDMTQEELTQASKITYFGKMNSMKTKYTGRLKIKEYTAGMAHSGHFRFLINEMKLKNNFVPDVIIVDYLNICGSSRVTKAAGLYEYNKNIAEELRGLGQEFGCRVFTATQVNRDGAKTSDFDITDTSESFGVPATADYFYGIIQTEELAQKGKMRIKRLKDRYQDINVWYPSFMIGVDKKKQRIYDISDDESQEAVEYVFENNQVQSSEEVSNMDTFMSG